MSYRMSFPEKMAVVVWLTAVAIVSAVVLAFWVVL